mgnify:CR=1 FL=1
MGILLELRAKKRYDQLEGQENSGETPFRPLE